MIDAVGVFGNEDSYAEFVMPTGLARADKALFMVVMRLGGSRRPEEAPKILYLRCDWSIWKSWGGERLRVHLHMSKFMSARLSQPLV